MRFPVVLHTDDGVRFGVTVPDLPGCFSAGDTFDEALDSVVEAIDLHLEEDGDPVPRAEHRANPDLRMACGRGERSRRRARGKNQHYPPPMPAHLVSGGGARRSDAPEFPPPILSKAIMQITQPIEFQLNGPHV
jgi:predicted RNase H-like HicB family nuclease